MREQRRARNICGTRRCLGPRVRQVGTQQTGKHAPEALVKPGTWNSTWKMYGRDPRVHVARWQHATECTKPRSGDCGDPGVMDADLRKGKIRT